MKKQTAWSGAHNCDICGKVCENTLYDARTGFGAWGTMCEECFRKLGTGLGTGSGQKYQLNQNSGLFEKKAG